jgi:hypothetical protein
VDAVVAGREVSRDGDQLEEGCEKLVEPPAS